MKQKIIYLLCILPTLYSCLNSPDMTQGIVNGKKEPTVVTDENFEIPIDGTIRIKGSLISLGKSNTIANCGFYWGYLEDQLDNTTYSISTTNLFTAEISRLRGDTTYFWRAFAINEFGIDMGNVLSYNAPAIWEAKENFNATVRSRGTFFILNNRLYITCGERESSSGNLLKDTWEYIINDNKWWQADEFPGSQRRYPTSFTIGNQAFVGTGQASDASALNDFYKYDSESNSWTVIPVNNAIEVRYQAIAFSLNNKGYLVGGRNRTQRLNDVWQYTLTDGEDGQWTRMNDFPTVTSGGISISGNNRIFVGFDEIDKTLWEYKAETDSWEEFSKLPDTIITVYSGVLLGDDIYIVDGNNRIWTLNLTNKKWNHKASLPDVFIGKYGQGGYQNLFLLGNTNSIYVGLGFSRYFYEYRPLWDN